MDINALAGMVEDYDLANEQNQNRLSTLLETSKEDLSEGRFSKMPNNRVTMVLSDMADYVLQSDFIENNKETENNE